MTYYLDCPPLCSATATTAACGRNKEEPLGLRPAGCECRLRHEADTGSRNPNIFSGNFIFIITEEQRLRPLLFCFFTGGAVILSLFYKKRTSKVRKLCWFAIQKQVFSSSYRSGTPAGACPACATDDTRRWQRTPRHRQSSGQSPQSPAPRR